MKSIFAALVLFSWFSIASAEEQDEMFFEKWMRSQSTGDYDQFLQTSGVFEIIPNYQLLRTASYWKECGGPPFEIPPATRWENVKNVLILIAELQKLSVLTDFEVVSGYRNKDLNRCVGGSLHSSHAERFAVDLVLVKHPSQSTRLCQFWLTMGKKWNMGLSKYPSGRIHLDVSGYRTWGANHKADTSYCKPS